MTRAAFYVDGFNLFHSLKETRKTERLLWLDIQRLCAALIAPGESLVSVKYFTALAHWNKERVKRHQLFITALESTGVKVIYGRFSPASRDCMVCRQRYQTHEEKETDVNIAASFIRDGLENIYDVAYLMTGDSDQVPAIRTLRAVAPSKKLVAVFSVNRHSNNLKNLADRSIQLTWHNFAKTQLPNPVVLRSGRELHCPPSWMPIEGLRPVTLATLPPPSGSPMTPSIS